MEDYALKTVLKICWRSSLVYLGAWKAAELGPGFEGPVGSSGAPGRVGNLEVPSSPLRKLGREGPYAAMET